MVDRHGLEVVGVQVGVHPDVSLEQLLVILGPRQRRQQRELEQVDRQLLLHDLDIAANARGGVAGQAEDIAGIGDGARPFPGLQHLSIFGDAVLALLHLREIFRIDALEADEDVFAPRARRLVDEVRDLVRERVDLDQKDRFNRSRSRSSIMRSKIASQFLLRAKLSSVMKNRETPRLAFCRRIRSMSSASRQRDFLPCTLMIVQNEHWNGQPRPASNDDSTPS